ncbi:MAG: hypothetical protein U0794_02670 [Isosphaeraceae bacterium]
MTSRFLTRRRIHWAVVALSAMIATTLAGCTTDDTGKASFSTVTAKGTVTAGGKPVTKGIIVFEPLVDGGSTQQASGEISAEGKFELKSPGDKTGAMPGKYRVKLESDEYKPKKAVEPPTVEVKDGQDLIVAFP